VWAHVPYPVRALVPSSLPRSLAVIRYVCSLCKTAREPSDMASYLEGNGIRWFCHPAESELPDVTCYMKFTINGYVLTSRPVVHFSQEEES